MGYDEGMLIDTHANYFTKTRKNSVATVYPRPGDDNENVPAKKTQNFRLGPAHRKMLEWLAKDRVIDMSEMVRTLIKDEFDRRKAQLKKANDR